LADWGTRALGFLVDYAPVFLVGIIFSFNRGLLSFVGLLGLAYWILMGYLDGVTGQTPGKAIMGTKVVNAAGGLLGSGAGIGRKFLHILDSLICGLGYLLPIVDAKRQTIADKVMTTYVVSGVEKRPFSVDLWMPPRG
jgi:uncharacterized RDD family membrane protein YckC